jgi:hypothetical protein
MFAFTVGSDVHQMVPRSSRLESEQVKSLLLTLCGECHKVWYVLGEPKSAFVNSCE